MRIQKRTYVFSTMFLIHHEKKFKYISGKHCLWGESEKQVRQIRDNLKGERLSDELTMKHRCDVMRG